jgi:NlpC/P60 family
MFKQIIPIVALAITMGSCNTFRQFAGTVNRTGETPVKQNQARFLNDITVTPAPQKLTDESRTVKTSGPSRSEDRTSLQSAIQYGSPVTVVAPVAGAVPAIESASSLQFKFALLLNTEVEQVQNLPLYTSLNYWLGTRYCMGGTTKRCIDCSAFTMSVYSAAYNTTIARTAREQYRTTQRISRTELREGDLVFFNTRGGISHVGIYLQNNKFVHATTSKGVMVSDLYDDYWVRRFVGTGRVVKQEKEEDDNITATSN